MQEFFTCKPKPLTMLQANTFVAFLPLAIFVLMVQPLQVLSGWSCGAGWHQSGQKCYLPVKIMKTSWSDAQVFCQATGGDLASPRTKAELDAIRHVAITQKLGYPWIGVVDIASKGHWVSSVSHGSIQVSDWGHGQPNNGGNSKESCVCLSQGDRFKWHDYPCHEPHDFICERTMREC